VPFDPARVAHFILTVGPIIDSYGGWVYSWGRSPERNADVDGNTASEHLSWTAVDAGFYSSPRRDMAYRECYSRGLHGYKKSFEDPEGTGKTIYGFHMQSQPGRAPARVT
jgi:hypothetical protein